MTSYTWDTIREEALAAGIDGFLAKPIFASNVTEEFKHIVRRNHAGIFKKSNGRLWRDVIFWWQWTLR